MGTEKREPRKGKREQRTDKRREDERREEKRRGEESKVKPSTTKQAEVAQHASRGRNASKQRTQSMRSMQTLH